MHYLHIRNWDKWQSYRGDRGQPPWIKIHRQLMRNPEWISLTDAQRGRLLAIWLLAADRSGTIPSDPLVIQRLCYLDIEPELNLFIDLGFIEPDVNVTPKRRQYDANMTPERRQYDANMTHQSRIEAETETEEDPSHRKDCITNTLVSSNIKGAAS